MRLRYGLAISFCMAALFLGELNGEIARVTIRWTPQLCQGNCTSDLLKYLNPISGNAETDVDLNSGQARLRWKPLSKFSFDSINNAMRMIGLRVREVRVKVRGTITHDSNTVTMTSIGDNTAFTLMSPVQPRSPNEAVVEFSTYSHVLTEEIRQKLIYAQTTYQIVEIEGPMFMPTRSIAYNSSYLIVDQLNFPNPPFKPYAPQ